MKSLLCVILLILSIASASHLRIAFLWVGPIDDFGFNYVSEVGRVNAMMKIDADEDIKAAYPDLDIKSVYLQNLDTEDKVLEAVKDEVTQHGTQLFFTTTGSLLRSMCKAALIYPDATFITTNKCPDTIPDNQGYFATKFHFGRFISGYICALHGLENDVKKYNKIGFVGPKPFTTITPQQANAFLNGARRANPDVEVYMVESDYFYSPIVGTEASKILLDAGVGCIAALEDANSVPKYFVDNGEWAVGYTIDLRYNLGELVLHSATFDYSEVFFSITKQFIMDGNKFDMDYNNPSWLEPSPSGFSNFVSVETKEKANLVIQQLLGKEIDVFCDEDIVEDVYDGLDRVEVNGHTCVALHEVYNVTRYSRSINILASLTEDDVIKYTYFSIHEPIGKAFLALVIISTIIYILIFVDIMVYRELEIYRAASPVFCTIILAGLTLVQVSLIFWMFRPSRIVCNFRIWLLFLSLSIIYSALIFKNWRIMKIFLTDSLSVFRISNADLMVKMVLPYVLGSAIILVLWTTFDIYDERILTHEDNSSLDVNEIEIMCSSKTPFGMSAAIIYLALLLIFGCVVAYRTRGVSKINYKEAAPTAWISYNSLLVLIIATILEVALGGNPGVLVTDSVMFFAMWFVCIAFALLLFLPKLWRLHIKKKVTVHSTSSNRKKNTSGDESFGRSEL